MATKQQSTSKSKPPVKPPKKLPEDVSAAAGIDDAGYQRLIELSPMPIAVHMNGILVYANKATAKLIHAETTEQLIGRNVMDFVHPDSRELVLKRVGEIYREGKQSTDIVEEKFICEDGEIINVEIASLLFHYQGNIAIQLIVRDITEQLRARQALIESEERFRQLADSMPQMVWVSDATGRINYRNKKWFESTGVDEITTASWLPLIHPDDAEPSLRIWQQALKTGKPFQAEYRMKDYQHPGRYRWYLSRAVAVRDEQGAITKWFGTSTDITDVRRTSLRKKELERVAAGLSEQRRQLVALNQAKDEFISLASHQLRTPATGVKQFVGMVLEGFAGEINPEVRKFLEKAYESNDRQIAIVNDLLHVAQVDAGKVTLSQQLVDISSLLQSAVQEQMSRFEKRQQIVFFKPSKQPLKVLADGDRLRMALDNLIDNASKYTPPGKSITITTTQHKDTVSISIADQGVGIDPADYEKIFLKFSRLDNPLSTQVGGSGLGLYWVRKIIDLHGGSIEVDSKPGKGSVFRISLPKQ